MKEIVRQYLEWLHKKESRYEASVNPVIIHLANGKWFETSTSIAHSIIIHEPDKAYRVDLWPSVGHYYIGGKAYTPVEYAMYCLFGEDAE